MSVTQRALLCLAWDSRRVRREIFNDSLKNVTPSANIPNVRGNTLTRLERPKASSTNFSHVQGQCWNTPFINDQFKVTSTKQDFISLNKQYLENKLLKRDSSTFIVTMPPGTCIANNDNLPDLPRKQWEYLKDRLSVCTFSNVLLEFLHNAMSVTVSC
jgi:hypothetical protein